MVMFLKVAEYNCSMKILLNGPIDPTSHRGRWISGIAATLDYKSADVHFKSPVTVSPPITRGQAFLLAKKPLQHYDLQITVDQSSPIEKADKTILLTHSPYLVQTEAEIVWAFSHDTAQAAREQSPQSKVVARAPGIAPGLWKPIDRAWYDEFKIFTTNEWAARALSIEYADPRYEDMKEVFKHNHVMVVPLGEPDWALEFMATGGCVMAHASGMNNLWLNNLYSYRYYRGDDMEETLYSIIDNPEQAMRRANLAAEYIGQSTWEKALQGVFDEIGDDRLSLKYASLKSMEDVNTDS